MNLLSLSFINLSVCLFSLSSSAEEIGYPVELALASGEAPLLPGISAPGTKLPLRAVSQEGLAGFDHLSATLPLRSDSPQKLLVARDQKNGPYNLFFVDSDLDGSFEDETPVLPNDIFQRKSGSWGGNFEANLLTRHVNSDQIPKESGDYPAILWLSMEEKNEVPELIRFSGRATYFGGTEVDGLRYEMIVFDMTNDGLITESDYWKIVCVTEKEGVDHVAARPRRIGDFLWANGAAWNISLNDTKGGSLILKKHETKLSEQEDREARDPYAADRAAPKAKVPVLFLQDYAVAKKKALAENLPLVLKFETTWCGPCAMMNRLVFNQEQVVAAGSGFVWLKVDGDLKKDLVEKYKVKGYPTFVVLDSRGEEVSRFGTASGEQLVAILAGIKENVGLKNPVEP